MGKSVSHDLRLRLIQGILSGKSRRAVAAQFEVAPSTAVRVQARYETTGSISPAKQGRSRGSGKLGACRAALIDEVEAQPDITMPDLAAWLAAEHGVTADPSNLSKLLCKAGFTYKKTCWHRRKNALMLRRHAKHRSPDLNPIEMAFAKLKILLRKAKARTYEALGNICALFSSNECQNYLKDAGRVAD